MTMDKFEQLKKINWAIEVSLKNEFLSVCLLQSALHKIEKKLGLPLSRELMLGNDVYQDSQQLKTAKEIIRRDLGRVSGKIFSVIEKQEKELVESSRAISLEPKHLLREIKKWFAAYKDAVSLIVVSGRLDDVLEEDINKELKQSGVGNAENVFRTIAQPERLSSVAEEKIALMKMVSENKATQKNIQNHARKYAWITSTLLLGDLYSPKDVATKIKKIKKNKSLNNEIESLEKLAENNRKEFKKAKKQYNFKPELLEKINILRHAIWFRTARLDWLNESCALARPLLEMAAAKVGLSYDELIYCSPEEIINALSKNKKIADKKDIFARMGKYAMWTLDGKKCDFITGDEVDKLKSALFEESHKAQEIKGLVAYEGRAWGRVAILKDRSEIKKLKQGEILVARLTTPDFVPAMEKAKAIITDLGGITSHAAIVARELKIPCIVGTKIATKALKDGDLVEVDANRGIVKILK